jgi:Stage II sporulation protein E (SpoIIE)
MSLTGGDSNGRARAARRVLAVALVGCSVFALQSLPTASAAKSGTSTVTSTSEGSAATRRAERAAAKAEGAPPPQPPAAPSVEAPTPAGAAPHGHHAQPGPPPAPPAGLGAGAGAGATPHKGGAGDAVHAQRREERREARRSSSSTSTSTAASGAGAKPAVTTASGESSAGQAEAFARKQKKGSGGGQNGGQKGKKEHKGKKAPQEEGSGTEGGSEGASGPSAKPKGELNTGDAAAQETAVAASFALPAAVPDAGTAPASVNSALPAANAGAAGGVNAKNTARRAARHARKRSSATAALATASASPLLATQSSAVAASASRAKLSADKRSKPQSSQPALVKTFTKIVGVVPTPVRILIGALILLALMLGVRSLFSGVRTRRLVRQRGQLLEDVGLLQAALLPEPPARLGPVATSVAYRPADGPGAGGDFYDVFALEDGEIAVIVGDVSGHGREALPHTALLRFTVRAYLEAGLSPRKALQTAGNVLDRQLAGSFATVLAATYNPRERKLTYASAGHPPPVMLGEHRDRAEAPAEGERAARALESVTSCSAPPIGAGMPTGTRQTVVSIAGPTRLCFHTDGVTEARIDEQLFGAERLAAALADLHHDADASALLDRVSELSDARPDDMAACLLRVHDGQGSPAIALEQLELSRELLAGGRVERFLLDCGVELDEAESIVQDARQRLQRVDRVMLELVPDADRPPIISLIDDNVIRTAALATAGAS